MLSYFISAPVRAIRLAEPDDAEACALLHAEAFFRPWTSLEFEELLASENIVSHVLVRTTGLVDAFVLSRQAGDQAEILSIVTAATIRRLGHAARLLAHHKALLRDFGVRELFLEVNEHNRAAITLYSRAGFAEVGRRDGYYAGRGGGRETALVLRCEAF